MANEQQKPQQGGNPGQTQGGQAQQKGQEDRDPNQRPPQRQ